MKFTNWTLKSDVLAKVKQDGNNLRFAAPELKADHDVVIEAFTRIPPKSENLIVLLMNTPTIIA